jgi:hypothetical protein
VLPLAKLTAAPTKAKTKVKRKPAAPPPDFDRAGEMPEGAAPARAALAAAASKSGLAAIDLSATATPHGRYDEYTEGDDLPPREPGPSVSPPAEGVAPADVPANEVEVKVIKRKKKSKKPRAPA